jgi:PAS domain S-box-containing protein
MIQALQAGDAYDNAQCYEVLLDLVEYESRSDHSPGDHLNHTGDLLRRLGLLVSLRDPSAEEDDQFSRRMAEQLDLSQADLVKLVGHRQVGIWIWKVSSGELFWSKEVFRIMGVDPEKTEPGFSACVERIHSEDRPFVDETFARVVREKCDYELDYRFVRLDGSIRRFHTEGHPILDASGGLAFFVGMVVDITEQNGSTATGKFFKEISALKGRHHKKEAELGRYQRGSQVETGFESDLKEIVGQSPSLQQVLQLVSTVSGTGATVLILGETGTEKELVARAIHDASQRHSQPFVRMNCAMSAGLLESELFGHERGAFSSALSQKIGSVELADKGTLFLDEVGDISLELQPKLLRFLQERQFERLGSTRTRRVDTRIVATTHRDLFRMVAEGTFRRDLFYRLSMFPIHVPPLRQRRDDIPFLMRYFTQKYCRVLNRKVETIPRKAEDALVAWDWPGNIRELEAVIERAVLRSSGRSLDLGPNELKQGRHDRGRNPGKQ